ncbi:MAG: Phosphoserine phosphatase RsbU [Tenericutes bacterium ADurb.BinA155]|nr:MAG: Phosphoserine phosphatase RsbU [Tenericutes bacterium ADurb.BinA155]
MDTFLSILQLAGLGAIDIVVGLGFYFLDKYTAFKRWNFWLKQALIGLVFGGLAVLGTEFGVKLGDAIMNVRDAAPLAAGLFFGWPAGVIAGVIGGLERLFSGLYGDAGSYTVVACTIATAIAGIFGGLLRRFMFQNKRPAWYYSFSTGIVVEVFHMLLIFLTRMDQIDTTFKLVRAICWPMIGMVAITLMILSMLMGFFDGVRIHPVHHEHRPLAKSFQRWLLLSVLLGFFAASSFTYFTQVSLGKSDADSVLQLNVDDAVNDVSDTTDKNLLAVTKNVMNLVSASSSDYPDYYTAGMSSDDMKANATQQKGSQHLQTMLSEQNVSDINIVNSAGLIIYSETQGYIGFNMNAGDNSQATEFYNAILVDHQESYVQPYQPISINSNTWMKYAAYQYTYTVGGESRIGFVQVGYNSDRFKQALESSVSGLAKNRHVGKTGCLVVADSNSVIVSDSKYNTGKSLSDIGLTVEAMNVEAGTRFIATVYGEKSYCMFNFEGYFIIGILPQSEVILNTSLSVYISVFMEVEVFAILFIVIYFLLKRLVVDNFTKVNAGLAAITSGNLNTTVDVKTSAEFTALSEDINETVVTLKGYIKEASERIDKELEFAKEIQLSALPKPLEDDPRFRLFASMAPAKEVGGDFYDYFLLGEDKIGLVIADVSGKGIPAALFMMKSKTLIKSLARSGETSPAKILEKANVELCNGNDADMFVTVWVGIYDFKSQVLLTANGGHEFPAIRHGDGSFSYFHDRHGLVLAAVNQSKYVDEKITLNLGDTLFVYTDGVTEATSSNNELFGEDRLLATLNAHQDAIPRELLPSVKASIDAFVGSAPQFDDITMLAFHVIDPKEPQPLPNELELTATLGNVEAATSFVNAHLEQYHCPPKAKAEIDIAIDELFSNIAHYAYNPEVGPATLRVETKKDPLTVLITFIDKGVPYDPLAKKDPNVHASKEEREIGGLGIYLVKKTMDDVVYEYKNGQNILTIKKTIEPK